MNWSHELMTIKIKIRHAPDKIFECVCLRRKRSHTGYKTSIMIHRGMLDNWPDALKHVALLNGRNEERLGDEQGCHLTKFQTSPCKHPVYWGAPRSRRHIRRSRCPRESWSPLSSPFPPMSISNKHRKVSRLDTCSWSKTDRCVANSCSRSYPRRPRDPGTTTMRWRWRRFSLLERETTNRDPREGACSHFAGFCGTKISRPARCRYLSPVCEESNRKWRTRMRVFHRTTYQFEDEILLVEMLQFVSRSSLRSICVSGPYDLRTPRLTRVSAWDAQEGRRAVDRVDDRLEETPSLELMRRNLSYGCRRSWATGAPIGGRVTSRSVGRTWKLYAAAGRRCRRRVWQQPSIHGLSWHFPDRSE